MDRVRLYLIVYGLLGVLSAGSALADAGMADLDDEDATPEFVPEPGSEWKEQQISLPPYPSQDDLIDIRLLLKNSPFKVLIDPTSVSVGADDRVVRYTVVLRSASGVENVSYEGIRCGKKMVQRYAYGSGGRFYPARNPGWRYIRKNRQDMYLIDLMQYFFCPLPTGDAQRQIVDRIKHSGSSPSTYMHELEE